MPMLESRRDLPPFGVWREHLRNPALRAAFAIGFCILFAFIGTFTYVNFVLVREPLSLSRMALGFVYFVFLPSIVTTPLAGRAVARFGARRTIGVALAVAGAGLPLLVVASLPAVLVGPRAGRRRHVPRAGRRDGIRRARGDGRPRRGQRHLPRLLFRGRPGRQRRAGPGVRSLRMGRVRRGRGHRARAGGAAFRRGLKPFSIALLQPHNPEGDIAS